MTDKELLERAADAAGIDAFFDCPELADELAADEGMFLNGKRSPDNEKYWNLLMVDGDALRLAVALNMEIRHIQEDGSDMLVIAQYEKYGCSHGYASESHGDDAMAATRRAITRAAATAEDE